MMQPNASPPIAHRDLSDDVDQKVTNDTPTVRGNVTPDIKALAERPDVEEDEVVRVCKTCMESAPEGAEFCPKCGEEVVTIRRMPDMYLREIVGGKYEIVEKIGQGGMGVVYLAQNDELGQKVAVKFLSKKFADDEDLVLRFLNEAKSYCRVNHPNAVTLLEYGQHDDGALYIITEFVDGLNVTETLGEFGPLAPDDVIDVGMQISAVLSAAHHQGVIHRDLKPDNVMLIRSPRGRFAVKVLDFGIAKIVDEEDGPNTETGSVFGTPEFMSPEQARGDAVDPRSDIYSLGVILFYMATGKLPFDGKNKLIVLNKQLNEDPPRPTDLRPELDIPPRLEAVIMKCLNKGRSQRYETADDLVEALEELRVPTGQATAKVGVGSVTAPDAETGPSEWQGGQWLDDGLRDPETADTFATPLDHSAEPAELESIDLQREISTDNVRRPGTSLPWIVAAAVALVLVGAALWAALDDTPPTTSPDLDRILLTGQVVGLLSAVEGMVADGDIDQASVHIENTKEWVTDEQLPGSARGQRRTLAERIDRLQRARDELKAHVSAGRCRQAEATLSEIGPLSSGLADELRDRVSSCERKGAGPTAAAKPAKREPSPANVEAHAGEERSGDPPPVEADVPDEPQESQQSPESQDSEESHEPEEQVPDGMALPPRTLDDQ